jgi:hypothetical protein
VETDDGDLRTLTDDSARLDGVGVSSAEDGSEEGTVNRLSLGQVEEERGWTLDNSAVSGNSLDTVGVGLDKEILDAEEGLGKERLGVEGGSGISAASNPLSAPYSLGGGEGMVPISEGVGPILLFVLLIDRLLHSSAVIYSVDRSETHSSAVTYSVEQTSAVL